MFSWTVALLVIALTAALFAFSGLAGTAANIAWILFVVALFLAVLLIVMGRGDPPP